MKTKTKTQSGVGLIGWVIILGVVPILFWIVVGVVWYLKPITGTPLPLPVRQGGFIPIPVNDEFNAPDRCHCGGACWMMP